jgi:putative aldouronate transport system permease protein
MKGNSMKKRELFKKRKSSQGGMIEKRTTAGIVADIVIFIFLALVIFVCIMPLWHVLAASFSDGQTLMANKGLLFWPVGKMTLGGYAHVFEDSSILRGYMNTLLYVAGTTVLGLVINTLAGYCLSRKIKLKTPLTLFVMFTMMFSGGMIPTYMVIRALGFMSNPLAILIPGCTNAFFIVIMKTAFESVPEAVVEAAQIDGAGHLRIMFQICLPQVRAFAVVVVLYNIVAQWNSWFPAAIYLTNAREWWPLQLFIKEMIGNNKGFLNNANPDYSRYLIQYALIIVATLPILVVFPFFQRIFEKGAVIGGVKE